MRAAIEHFHNALSPALTPSSPLSISVFSAAFGGFGLVWTKVFGTLNVAAGAGASLLVAAGMAAGTLAVFNRVSPRSSPTPPCASGRSQARRRRDPRHPARRPGTVSYEAAGRRHSAGARAIAGRSFRRGARVSIVRVDQGVVHVDHPLDRPLELPDHTRDEN
jgi:hypothetical protein